MSAADIPPDICGTDKGVDRQTSRGIRIGYLQAVGGYPTDMVWTSDFLEGYIHRYIKKMHISLYFTPTWEAHP